MTNHKTIEDVPMRDFARELVLAHDSFTQDGGAERVVEIWHQVFPDSVVYTLAKQGNAVPAAKRYQVKESPLRWALYIWPIFQYWFPIIPLVLWFWRVRDKQVKVLLSSSSGFMKGLRTGKGVIHLNYCHTPSRFLWGETDLVIAEAPAILRPFARPVIWLMRRWDVAAAQNVNYFIANSREVQQRITKYYHRSSLLLQPPIDTDFWRPVDLPKENFFLVGGRLNKSKRVDLVIAAAAQAGVDLVVFGTGREDAALRELAGSRVKFVGRIDDNELRNLYTQASGLINAQVEDFGLTPLEAAACGTPTIATAAGGALETVIDGVTGKLIPDMTVESLSQCLQSWSPKDFSAENLRKHAEQFSIPVYQQKLKNIIEKYGYAHRH